MRYQNYRHLIVIQYVPVNLFNRVYASAIVDSVKEAERDMEKQADFDPLSCLSEEEKQTLEELLIKLHDHVQTLE